MRVTASLEDDHQDELERLREVENLTSDAAAVRIALERSAELERARDRIDELQQRTRELESELMATNRRIDDTQELVEYVEEEREVVRERARREREREAAGILTRSKWWLFGRDVDAQDGD
jgi:chromosome segregation ATPase